MREELRTYIDAVGPELRAMSDDIFDHPEHGGTEVYACLLYTSPRSCAGISISLWGRGTA